MATYYANEFVGQADNTRFPPSRLDGRVIGAKERRIRATKPVAQALAVGDLLYIGRVPQGSSMRGVSVNSDTSFGATTLNVGTLANPTKYVNGKTMTNTDVPTGIGPRATQAAADPITADDDIYVQIGAAGIAAGVNAVFELTYTISA